MPDNTRWPLTAASRSLSLLQLGTLVGSEIVDVVEGMHGTIARTPSPFDTTESGRTRGITQLVYSGVRAGFGVANFVNGSAARATSQWDGRETESDGWIRARAAISGVYGDTLESADSPLAESMRLVQQSDSGSTLVLFVHGLCMSELGWQRGEHPEFVRWCEETLDANIAYVRYNSGRAISDSGCDLADLLEEETAVQAPDRLILIGHSMGGLVARSGCEHALQREQAWLRRLTHIVTLGSPHLGAPAERIGNFANELLGKSPYTRPLCRLGNLRSQGIQDLRYGRIEALSGGSHLDAVQNLFVAATRSPAVSDPVWHGKDDLLVPVASALGLSRNPQRRLEPREVRRRVVAGTDHMELLGSPEVYSEIRDWLS